MSAARRIAAAAVLMCCAAALSSARGAGAADPPATIRVGATGNDAAAEVYYADELGFFKKRNLTVQIQNLRNGAAEAAAVAGGALDVGEQNMVSMSTAHARGLGFKYLAPAASYNTTASTTDLLVAKDSPVKTARDLNGKTVAVGALGDLMQIAAEAWIDKNGGDSTSVKFVEIPTAEIATSIARGTVVAGVVAEPALSAAQNTRILAKPYDAIGEHFMINGWFATEDWIKKNPSAAKRFADAIFEAARWANAHHAESAKIFERHSKVEPGVIEHMVRVTYGERFDAKTMQNVVDTAARYKVLAQAFPVNELLYADI